MKNKNLGDYIRGGKHIFPAFVRTSNADELHENELGDVVFGLLVCERENRDDETAARFFHKSPPIYPQDSDIMFGEVSYYAQVDKEYPLAITTPFKSHYHLNKDSEEFEQARTLLSNYGMY